MARLRTTQSEDNDKTRGRGWGGEGGGTKYEPVSSSKVVRFKTRRTELVTQVMDAVVVVSPISAASPK